MNNITIMTHRCVELLEYNNSHTPISIRKMQNPTNYFEKLLEYGNWSLFKLETDYEYDSTRLEKICNITYCPFCSLEL